MELPFSRCRFSTKCGWSGVVSKVATRGLNMGELGGLFRNILIDNVSGNSAMLQEFG